MRDFLNQMELAAHWKISPRSYERWRWIGDGPPILKIGGRAISFDAFLVLAAKFEIDAMMERLADLSTGHFETSPDEINWGHVGPLNHICT